VAEKSVRLLFEGLGWFIEQSFVGATLMGTENVADGYLTSTSETNCSRWVSKTSFVELSRSKVAAPNHRPNPLIEYGSQFLALFTF
jgi:hypothetical protein